MSEKIRPQLTPNAVQVLESRYLLRNHRGRLTETPTGMFRRVARTIAAVEGEYGTKVADVRRWEDLFFSMMVHGEFLPNTPTLTNAGASLGQLSACFVIPIEDSVESIFDALKSAAEVHKSGGGTGFDFSRIRPRGGLVRSTGGTASGPVSFMRIFDEVTDVIRQGGKRRGANMGVLRVDHPDIVEFIDAKCQEGSLANFNVSVAVTDAFMRAAEKGGKYRCRDPRTGRSVGERDARQVFDHIVRCAWQSGDPGIIFIDQVNRMNPTRHTGLIDATNPCGEVPLHHWESCNLGSVNLAKCVSGRFLKGRIDWGKLRGLIRDGVRFLDDVITANRYPLPQCREIADRNRRIGLGLMGLAEAFVMMGIPYDSDRAVRLAGKLARFLADESHRASSDLARERGSFPSFRGSLWQKRGWKRMRNATTTTIAPTGTISIIAGCSSGIEPLFAISYVRNVLDGAQLIETTPLFERLAREKGIWGGDLALRVAATGSVQDIDGLTAEEKRLFRTALEIPVMRHVAMQAAIQKHVDNAVSKTVNLPNEAAPGDVREVYLKAWKSRCKGVTVYRYGSKARQVLNVGLNAVHNQKVVEVDGEFAGGCAAGVCSITPT
ncbi:adenosylcobalamin-dependent ribonucleoside-diphosphate reductase [Candidatus Uhrbacteria bacterium]|nr:adenosylcobalamin-dependent ribonucleoside-diphosphate reductase [Candidatus Uhrbacteria bacterium]